MQQFRNGVDQSDSVTFSSSSANQSTSTGATTFSTVYTASTAVSVATSVSLAIPSSALATVPSWCAQQHFLEAGTRHSGKHTG
jgi:hypothetical protein